MAKQYSSFWLSGGALTDPAWAARDALVHPAEMLTMQEWCALSDRKARAVVKEYSGIVPRRSKRPGRAPLNAERDAAVVAARARGVPAREVAAQFGISVERVYSITQGHQRRERGVA
jgi:hypothetical protein